MTVDEFIDRWGGKEGGAERSNYVLFLSELCSVLELPHPDPAGATHEYNDYVFERFVRKTEAGEPIGTGRIDLYKRGCFVLEAKQSRWKGGTKHKQRLDQISLPEMATKVQFSPLKYDVLMRDARRQAEEYARALPHEWPPFIIVCDVGRAFEFYFDWSGMGKDYGFFPDKQNFRIELARLRERDVQDQLRAIWTNPKSIDPRLRAAEVTREIAERLANVSRYLEASNRHRAKAAGVESQMIEETSLFLMRIIFCIFAEDVDLLPKDRFKSFLADTIENQKRFEEGLHDLWLKMNSLNGGFAWAVDEVVRYFNGGLFEFNTTYVLSNADRAELLAAARADWRKVEPAIFGTLLEQALTAEERAKLGAHYTPRPYVERIVDATIMQVLKAEWAEAQAAIEAVLPDYSRARKIGEAFHKRLAAIRVLDPACGTGNFLYVSMELMQRLESEVIEAIQALGGEGSPKVGPQQFYGLEKNPRAAKIAELVLWIGWLRFRIKNNPDEVPDPVLERSVNINFGLHGGYDAVLSQTVIGEPDLNNPTPPPWPEAEFIVGNPPFIGGKDIRERLGGDYAQALWKANPTVPPSADYVMQWWDRAAKLLTSPHSVLRRFGFVTTNSITQDFSRRVIAAHLHPQSAKESAGLSLTMAIPDHPWIKPPKAERKPKGRGRSKDRLQLFDEELGFIEDEEREVKQRKGPAAVRIAMTVAEAGTRDGCLMEVAREKGLDGDEPEIDLVSTEARIHANLAIGGDVTATVPLLANAGISSPGVKLHGAGFIVSPSQAEMLGLGRREGLEHHVKPYRNGRDLLGRPRGVMVIDLFGKSEAEVEENFPEIYQHLLKSVRNRHWNEKKRKWEGREEVVRQGDAAGGASQDALTYLEFWWLHGKPRPELRLALKGLQRYIGTVETSKHRVFQFLDASILPDNMIVSIASDDGFHLGVLQSRIHLAWSRRAGGTLEDRPRYTKSRIFDPFPFPLASAKQKKNIAELAGRLEAAREAGIQETPRLTMTELYNLRERIAAGERLTGEEEGRATTARAYIVNNLHTQIDEAVADAYGWSSDLAPAEIVARIVELNAKRSAEEEEGQIHWLRPDYQQPRFGSKELES